MKGIAALKSYESESKIANEEYENQIYSGLTGSKLKKKLIYGRKVEPNFTNCLEI